MPIHLSSGGRIVVIVNGVFLALIGLAIFLYHRHKHNKSSQATVDTIVKREVRKERLKSDIILTAIEDGVIVVDNNGTIQLFNPGAARITGWSAEEAIGLDYAAVLRLVDDKNGAINKEVNPLSRIFHEGKPIHDNSASLVAKAGDRFPISLSVSPLIDSGNKVSAAVGIFRDISTERAEEQRRAEFISTASHEMRTPVAAIEGYLALALNDRVSHIDSKAREYLDKAHASTQHLGKLFQDLLTSARAEDGRLSNHPVAVEMSAFLEQLIDGLRFTAEKKGLHLEFLIGSNTATVDATDASKAVVKPLYYVHVDPDRMREVVVNLFDNAVKYTESGKVSIGLTGDSEVVQLRITDTGTGIPTEDISHLFQKFYRVDSSATRTIGGTGLGLFIARKIIELYHGKIWVESQLQKGSTFFINLPRLSTQKATQLQSQEAKDTSPLI
ncbi:MAG: putative sensor protein [Candidatus Saccharibacteria bacterium]|nr:putative sensor protein [Candidatus Saccharibacteria bacterium]